MCNDMTESVLIIVVSTCCYSDAPPAGHSSKSLKRSASNTKTDQPGQETPPPEYILPGATELPPLATLLPADPHSEVSTTLHTQAHTHTQAHAQKHSEENTVAYTHEHTDKYKEVNYFTYTHGFQTDDEENYMDDNLDDYIYI